MIRMSAIMGVVLSILLCSTAHPYDIKVLSEIPVGGSVSEIAVSHSSDRIAAIGKNEAKLYIIDTTSCTVAEEVELGDVPTGVAIHEKSNAAAVSMTDGEVHFFDISSGEPLGSFDAGTPIYDIVVKDEKGEAVLGVDGGLIIADLATFDITRAIAVPGKIYCVSISRDSAVVSRIDDDGGWLKKVDIAGGHVTGEAVLSGELVSIGIDEPLGYVLVTQVDKTGLALYDLDTLGYIGEITTGKRMEIISVNPSTHLAVLADTLDGSLSVVDLETKTVADTLPLFDDIGAVCIDTLGNTAYISHGESISMVGLENPVPSISELVPEECDAGEPGFPLSVGGKKFVGNSQTWFNEKLLDTDVENTGRLKAQVPSEELLEPGDVKVAVTNPTPGGGMSNELSFRILTPAPQVSALVPETAIAGETFTLRVEGKNYLPSSYVNFEGDKIDARFVSSTVLESVVDGDLIPAPGGYQVSVTNPSPNSFTSNPADLDVVTEEEANAASATPPQPAGKGSLTGRILNTERLPLIGVGIKTQGLTAYTDGDGYFRLDNIPAGRRTVLLDGSSALEDDGHYPTIPVTVDIASNRVNELPFQPYFHRQKNRNFVNIDPSSDTVLTDPEVPGFEMRIPKGVNITGWDGKRNLKVSVRTVPADRLPVKPLPKGVYARNVYMFYFDKVGGGIPDSPIPVRYPNNLGLRPGEKALLWYFDESPNEGNAPNDWAIAGTCTVTPNGKYIVSDPGVGMPKFCCGASTPSPAVPPAPPTSKDPCSPDGDPVDLSTGYFVYKHTDMHIPGIIPVEIRRTYRSRDSGSAAATESGVGAFGKGMEFEYDWWLIKDGELYILFKPGNYQYWFTEEQPGSGVYKNTADPAMRSVKVTEDGGGIKTLEMRDGWKYKFNNEGGLIEIADRNENKLTFVRRIAFEGSSIEKIITAEGREIILEQTIVDTPGGPDFHFFRLDAVTDHTGRRVEYSYEDDPYSVYPRLTGVEYLDGGKTIYGYDSQGRMNTITNQRGIVEVVNEYDTDGRVVKQTHADGGMYTYSYNAPAGLVIDSTITAPNGSFKKRYFNDDGYITQIDTPDGTTINTRAATNELISVEDALGRTTTYTYYSTSDATNGLVHTKEDSLGNVTTYEYETTYGFPTRITDALLNETTLGYTFDGDRLTQTVITDPLLQSTTVNYNVFAMYSSVTDPNGNTTTFLYDPANHAELVGVSDPLGNTVSYAYDDMGRIASVTDANGATTVYDYDIMSRVRSVTDAGGGQTQYYYDLNGNLDWLIDAKGNDIRYEYDNRDHLVKMTEQLGREEVFVNYTGSQGDRLWKITDRENQETTFEYDLMGRVKKATYDDGTYTEYTYDAGGRVTQIYDTDSGTTIGYTYNDYGCGTCSGVGMDRIAQETVSGGVNGSHTVAYTYDALGRRVSMTLDGEPTVSYAYDAAGRLTKVSRDIGGTKDFNIAYDNAGRRTSREVGLYRSKGKWKNLTASYGYDAANRLTSINHVNPLGAIEDFVYTYDPNGNRRSVTTSNAALLMAAPMSGTSYDEANEMLSHDDFDLVYDNNGNLTSKTNRVTLETTTYTWDARNRLVGISGPSVTASFTYDALNRRIEKAVNGVTTTFVYDGWDIIQETTGSVTTNYTRTLNIDEPLAYSRSNGTVRYYVDDALRSITALTDTNGIVTTSYTYDAFGNVTITGSDYNAFQYTGRENDGTGLYYYRARYYSPEMRRFISEDPIRLRGGINFYSYVGNSPLNNIDPYGLIENPIPSFPLCSESFPDSPLAAPIADIVIGGIEAGFSAALGVAGTVSLLAGPEFWWITLPALPISIDLGLDAYDRMASGIDKLSDYKKCDNESDNEKNDCP